MLGVLYSNHAMMKLLKKTLEKHIVKHSQGLSERGRILPVYHTHTHTKKMQSLQQNTPWEKMLSFQKADTGLERWLRNQAHTCYTDTNVDETLIHIKETLKSHEKCRHKQQPGRRFKCTQLGGALDGRQHRYGDS